ncbi:MAG: pitrilysin family protein [Bacillota bacterium]|nr:pitrilysin family protein [Bacillota bacterium]
MFEKEILDNGVRIVCEKIPHVRSVSIGIWVGTGSRNENKCNNGVSHFIEHMLFKGTNSKSAKEIAESIDNIGGQLNAFTGKECTCYYTKTLDSHFDIAIDVLSDMFFNSKFDKKDIDVERKVIVEEIGMYQDSPEELVHDVLSETIWQGDPLGYPILGTQESLSNLNRDAITSYIDSNYTSSNSVISVAGNYDHNRLISMINESFGKWKKKDIQLQDYNSAEFRPDSVFMEKDTEQVHICIGFNGISHGKDDIYTLLAVNNIFGGGMSSRLFQKIREEKGLVYSIYSYPASYKDNGLFTIYAGMNPEHLDTVLKLVVSEIKTLKKKGISKEDLEKSKEQLKGNYILGLESTSSRMNSIGKSELMLGKIYSPDEILKKIDDINLNGVREIIDKIFDLDLVGFSAVGNLKNKVEIKNYI